MTAIVSWREYMKILLINGVNLNMLGVRDPQQYGAITLDQLQDSVVQYANGVGCTVQCYHSNSEGDIINRLQDSMGKVDGIIINAGAHSHYSYALRDCIEYMSAPVVSVHLSNIASREQWRRVDVLSDVVSASYMGEGIVGYYKAVDYLKSHE